MDDLKTDITMIGYVKGVELIEGKIFVTKVNHLNKFTKAWKNVYKAQENKIIFEGIIEGEVIPPMDAYIKFDENAKVKSVERFQSLKTGEARLEVRGEIT